MIDETASFLDAIRRGDRKDAFDVIDDALDRGFALHYVHSKIITPALREVGRLWQENIMTVAEEHLASGIAQAAMHRAFERTFHWKDRQTPRIVAACAPGEQHCIGLKMICDLLELDGWDSIYLGASVPVESFVDLVREKLPDAVGISAAIDPHVPRVQEVIDALRSADLKKKPFIVVGGRAFLADPSLGERVGADLTAADGESAVKMLDRAVRRT